MLLQMLTILLLAILVLLILRSTSQLGQLYPEHVQLSLKVSVFIGLWLIYLSVLDASGFLESFELPPRMPLTVILPIFIILGYTLTRPATGKLVGLLSMSYLTYVQGFRILVELIIWGGYQEGFLPVHVTFEGFNYDAAVGLSAIPMAHYARRPNYSRRLLLAWNIAGLLILANTVRVFLSAGFFPSALGHTESMLGLEFIHMPYLLIAGFFMPFAVYLHALSIKRLIMFR